MGDIQTFLEMDFKSGVLFLAAVVVVVVFIIQKWDFVVSRFGIKTKRMIIEETRDKATKKNQDEIEDLRNKLCSFIDRSDTRDTEILNSLNEVKSNIKKNGERRDYISAMEVRFSLTQRCEDAIAANQITFRGLQSIDDLYDVYSSKDYLGMNSYVTGLVNKCHKLPLVGDPIEREDV